VGAHWGPWGVGQLGILEMLEGALLGGSSLGTRKEGTGDGRCSLVRGPFTGDSED
jgi:hypothetical protein